MFQPVLDPRSSHIWGAGGGPRARQRLTYYILTTPPARQYTPHVFLPHLSKIPFVLSNTTSSYGPYGERGPGGELKLKSDYMKTLNRQFY